MNITLTRTTSSNPDFQKLVRMLDAELKEYNGEDNTFYAQFNMIEKLHNVVVAYIDEKPVGCGAFKEYSPGTAEVKRMYVNNDTRGKGIGKKILDEIESWAEELNYKNVIMETGKFLTSAVTLYSNSGYEIIPNYEPYTKAERSVCFRKKIRATNDEN